MSKFTKAIAAIMLTMAVVCAAGCNKNKENQGVAQFTATIEQSEGRTLLNPDNGQINWTAGDQIVISNADNETAIFNLQSGAGTTEGGFGTSDEFNTVGPFIAAYPSTAEIEADKVTFNLPATQSIGETGIFGNGANPMVAYSDDKNLQFKNLCGGLGIRLKGLGAHVTAVRITSKNTSEKLWGAYEVSDCASNEPTLTVASGNQGTNVITLNCNVTLTTAAKTFFVMLPPGTLANGFTMEVLDGNEVLATKETDSDVALVERNTMKVFNEILIDVEFDGNVEIPTGMDPSNIIVTNFGEDAVPDENGDFFIGYSKMLTAKNAENGKIIYISNLSADYDISKGDRQQNYELSAKETALHYTLCLIPFGIYQSKDATFNSIKDALYELTYVKNLETAIQNTVNQYGYLKTDEIGTELNALWNYLKADLLDQFFENGKSVSDQKPTIINKIELKRDGTIVSSIPNLPISRYRGVRLDIDANKTHFNPSSNTWTLSMTGYSENGVFIGVNKGTIGNDGLAYPSMERIHYYLPPMNVGKFMGTFTSYSGIRAYFQDTWRLFFVSGFGFDDMTWDMAKLEGITLELGRNDNAIMLMSPKDSHDTQVINVVYASLSLVGFALDKVLDTQGIDAFFTSLLNDAEFYSSVTANFGGGLSNFAAIAQDVLERLVDFLFVQGVSLLEGMDLDKALDYISDNAARALLEIAGNELGMIASWGLFDTFGLAVEAEFNDDLPSVSTQSYEVLSSTQAVVVAELESIGTLAVTEVGVCYSTSILPTVNDDCVSYTSIQMTGSYQCQLNDLQPNTTYYARAYAKCPLDIVVYGDVVSFTTGNGGGGGQIPTGAINGLFTINANGDQVYFSQGNLQYQASTNTWRFAEHQWDRLKEENINVSPTYDGWIDLFNWGTSGYNHGANCYQPWSTSTNGADYYAYGIETCNLYDQTGKADWGYNPISNGGNQENLWRTLTYDEWCYLLFDRETPSGIRFVKAKVNNINGAILLPHHWNDSFYLLNNPNDGGAYYDDNTVSVEDWLNILQEAGAVFLPNGANRTGISITSDENGDYWTSTRKMDGDFAYDICFQAYSIGHSSGNGGLAQSVRLVQDAK